MHSCAVLRRPSYCLGRRNLFSCGPRANDVHPVDKQTISNGNGSVSSLPGHLTNTVFSGDSVRGGHAARNGYAQDTNFYTLQQIAKLSEKVNYYWSSTLLSNCRKSSCSLKAIILTNFVCGNYAISLYRGVF